MKELDKSQKLECLDWVEEQVVNGSIFICILAKDWMEEYIGAEFDADDLYLYKAFPELVEEILTVGNTGVFGTDINGVELKVCLGDVVKGGDIYAFDQKPDDVRRTRLQVISTVRQNLNK